MNKFSSHSLLVLLITALPLLLACSTTSAQSLSDAPATYIASYEASANGITASASRSLTRLDDGTYELANELQATLLGMEIAHLDQRSRFHLANDVVITDRYSYTLSGVSSDRRSIEFDWNAGTALSIEDDESWTLALEAQVLDPLSHQFVISQQLRNDRSSAYSNTYEYKIVDGDEIDTHLYQFVGEEVLETPLGKLNTVKLERVRNNSSRSTIIWLAPDWEFLVARIEQTNGSLQMQLELAAAEIGGKVVSALIVDP